MGIEQIDPALGDLSQAAGNAFSMFIRLTDEDNPLRLHALNNAKGCRSFRQQFLESFDTRKNGAQIDIMKDQMLDAALTGAPREEFEDFIETVRQEVAHLSAFDKADFATDILFSDFRDFLNRHILDAQEIHFLFVNELALPLMREVYGCFITETNMMTLDMAAREARDRIAVGMRRGIGEAEMLVLDTHDVKHGGPN